MKKSVIISICIILVICLVTIILMFFNLQNELPTVVLKDDLSVKRNEKVKPSEFIGTIEKGKIVSKDKYIDTSNYGKQKIVIVVENNYGKKRDYIFFVEVK